MKRAAMQALHQRGASLLEVMVAMLLLSFGMLALGTLLAYAIQSPKLSGYHAIAVNLAASHVERIRANPGAFGNGAYSLALTYDGTFTDLASQQKRCNYPACTPSSLADMDNTTDSQAVRVALPAGGMLLQCDPAPCTASSYGNLWIVWQEPQTHEDIKLSSSDNCPAEVTGTYNIDPKPRCLYLRFKV